MKNAARALQWIKGFPICRIDGIAVLITTAVLIDVHVRKIVTRQLCSPITVD